MQKITGISILIVFIVGITLSTIVFQNYWNWFVSPLGIMNLTFTHSMGFVIFIVWIKYGASEDVTWNAFYESVIGRLLVFGLGFLIHSIGI